MPSSTSALVLRFSFALSILLFLSSPCTALDCLNAPIIDCDQKVQGDITGRTNNHAAYGSCGIPGAYVQGEQVWKFINPSVQDVSVSMDSGSPLTVFVLNQCDPAACIGSAMSMFGPGIVSLGGLAPGTYIIVVDGTFNEGTYDLQISCGSGMDCSNARTIRCGQTVQGTTVGQQNDTFTYNCFTGANLDGPDVVYKFDLNQIASVTFRLAGLVLPDMWDQVHLMLFNACDTSSCIGHAAVTSFGGALTTQRLFTGTYYLVIDTMDGLATPYELSVVCSNLDCASATVINCGDQVAGDNTGKPNNANSYNCFGFFDFNSGEDIYRFDIPQQTGIYIRFHDVQLQGMIEQLYLFLLDGCAANRCINYTYAGDGGSSQIVDQNLSAGTYYLVVDGYQNSAGPYKIDLFCGNLDSPQNIDIMEINGRGFPDIEITASITDRVGRFVHGLTIPDFTLTEEGAPQVITKLSEYECGSGIQVSVALVIDASGSMDGQPIHDAKQAAKSFINILAPSDRASIIKFDSTVTTMQAMTDDKTALRAAISAINSGGNTALFDGMYEGIDQCIPETGAKAVFAFTDGADNSSTETPSTVIDYALANGIPLYTIELGSSGDATLQHMAYATGGIYSSAPTAADLSQIYNTFYHNLKSNYVFCYTTSNPVADYAMRQVEICVPASNICGDESYQAKPNCRWFANQDQPVGQLIVGQGKIVGQQFLNTFFQGPVRDLEVEIFFDNMNPAEVAVSWWSDDNDKPGQKLSDADQGNSLIECPGWFSFSFYVNPLIIEPNKKYWVVVEHTGGDIALITMNQVIGPEGGVIEGNGPRPITWGMMNPDTDMFLRIYGCSVKPSPTPAPTNTPGGPTMTPSPAPVRPIVVLAGYMGTDLTSAQGGTMNFMAIASSPDNQGIQGGEFLLAGMPIGLYVPVTNPNPPYPTISYTLNIGGGAPVSHTELEFMVYNGLGLTSHHWPYLNVE